MTAAVFAGFFCVFAYNRRQNEWVKATLSMRWSVFKGKRRDAMKKKDIWPRILRKRRLRKVQLVIGPLFLPVSDFSCFSVPNSNAECFPIYRVSCAAGMQVSQATTVAVRLQPFAYMSQFLHTNINRAGVFHLTTNSVVQGFAVQTWLSFHPQKTKHLALRFSVGCFFLLRQCWCSRILPYLRTKLWQALSEWEAKKAPL